MTINTLFGHIEELIPQGPPFICVDALREWSVDSAMTSFLVPAQHYFVRDQKFIEAGLLENVAQTTAAHGGYSNRGVDQVPAVGYIAAFKNVFIHSLPIVGTELFTTIKIVNQVMHMTLVHAKISDGIINLLEGEIRIVREENKSAI